MAKKVYDQEFKNTIVSLYQSGKTVDELCSEFDISISSINRWRKEFGNTEDSKPPLNSEYIKELRALKKELKDIKLERDILKKAVCIFSKSDQ